MMQGQIIVTSGEIVSGCWGRAEQGAFLYGYKEARWFYPQLQRGRVIGARLEDGRWCSDPRGGFVGPVPDVPTTYTLPIGTVGFAYSVLSGPVNGQVWLTDLALSGRKHQATLRGAMSGISVTFEAIVSSSPSGDFVEAESHREGYLRPQEVPLQRPPSCCAHCGSLSLYWDEEENRWCCLGCSRLQP